VCVVYECSVCICVSVYVFMGVYVCL